MPRKKLDKYYTPAWMVEGLINIADINRSCTIFEPFNGDGAISRYFPHAITNDIDGNSENSLDMIYRKHWESLTYKRNISYIITNPPYKYYENNYKYLASHFVRIALSLGVNVAMLLRLSFLEPCKDRLDILKPDLLLPTNRHSFTGTGNDSVTTAWHVWYIGEPRITGIYHIVKPEEK
jgi:hypothetical protein